MELEWHKFSEEKPIGDCRILVCRDFGHDPFCITVSVHEGGNMFYYDYRGIKQFVKETRDRWTYIPMPEK